MKRLIADITTGAWMIEPSYAHGFAHVVDAILKGDAEKVRSFFQAANQEGQVLKNETYVITPEGKTIYTRKLDGKVFSPYDDAPAGSVAIIPVTGPIMKNDYCGDAGTATRSRQAKEADNHPNIASIIFRIDSGGGTVDGTQLFSETIKSLKKHTIAFVDGLAASAAYWIASPCKEIWLSSPTDILGSIGTMVTFRDYSKYLKKEGIVTHEIYATESKDKNGDYKEALKGNYDPIRENTLDPLNEQFILHVRKNRSGKFDLKREDIFTGKTYVGQKAIDAGLADRFGTLEQAVARAIEVANQLKTNNIQSEMKVKFKSALTAVAGFFGFKAAEGADHVEGEVSAEQWETLNARLATVEQLEADLTKAREIIVGNEDKISKLTSDLSARQAIIEGRPSSVQSDKTDTVSEVQKESLSIHPPAIQTEIVTKY